MSKLKSAARKTVVTLLGFLILIIGVILLVLPGPGILVIILGLVVLSWEYEWAKHHLDRARQVHKRAMTKIKKNKNT
jgi:uncharacterized protein (TIGR02611 family)